MSITELIESLIIAIIIVSIGWFIIIRPLRLLTIDLPQILKDYLKEWQMLNHNLSVFTH